MKSKILVSIVVVALLFIQELAAQGVSTTLRDKEKRQVVYFSIINDDERFVQFMEAVKASGRAGESLAALDNQEAEGSRSVKMAEKATSEDQLAMEQMVVLIKEMVDEKPELQKVIDKKYPEVGSLMKTEENKL